MLVEKRKQALQYLDATEAAKVTRNNKHNPAATKTTLNEDSLTEPSVEVASNEEIFQTAKASSDSVKESTSMGERMRITIRDNHSGKDGYEPFKSSKQDLESEKSMLLGSGTEDINNYLKGKLGTSNQDLIEHDQILISEQGFDDSDQQVGAKKQRKRFAKRDTINLASMTYSQNSYEPHQRSRTQLKTTKFPAMIVTDET